MGAVMVAVAVVMIANLDIRFENAIAADLPSAARRPDEPDRAELRGLERPRRPAGRRPASQEGGAAEAAAGKRLPVYFRAPDFTGTQQWFNTPGGAPAQPVASCGARSSWSTSGPTRASTASARCPTSRPGTASTTATGSPSSACTRRSSRSRRTPRTSSGRSATSASPTRSPRTTTTRPGAPTTTSTGRRTT